VRNTIFWNNKTLHEKLIGLALVCVCVLSLCLSRISHPLSHKFPSRYLLGWSVFELFAANHYGRGLIRRIIALLDKTSNIFEFGESFDLSPNFEKKLPIQKVELLFLTSLSGHFV
jgi:hypothetical protein